MGRSNKALDRNRSRLPITEILGSLRNDRRPSTPAAATASGADRRPSTPNHATGSRCLERQRPGGRSGSAAATASTAASGGACADDEQRPHVLCECMQECATGRERPVQGPWCQQPLLRGGLHQIGGRRHRQGNSPQPCVPAPGRVFFCSPLTPFPTCLTRTVKCKAHGGGRRCQYPNCPKSAQGATDRCKAHGGGRRCVYPQCGKSAVGKTHYCKGHGGGRRCNFEGCSKSAQGATWQCIAHGGGRRCKKDGCSKSARGSSNLCM